MTKHPIPWSKVYVYLRQAGYRDKMGIGKNPVGDFGPMIVQAQNLKEPNSLHWAVIINPTEFTEESMKFKPKQKKWKFVATNCWTNVKTDQLAPTLFLPAITELSKTNVPNIFAYNWCSVFHQLPYWANTSRQLFGAATDAGTKQRAGWQLRKFVAMFANLLHIDNHTSKIPRTNLCFNRPHFKTHRDRIFLFLQKIENELFAELIYVNLFFVP